MLDVLSKTKFNFAGEQRVVRETAVAENESFAETASPGRGVSYI